MSIKGKKVAVGMSGGVDSSLCAALLKEKGYDVFGLFMKNWDEKDPNGLCQASKDAEDVMRICDHLQIPFYSVNFTNEYYENVFKDLLDGLKKGFTPNPDILCNKEIKFKVFLQKALSLGADYLATGHYCQRAFEDDQYVLKRGADENKDQTYFLYTMQQKELSKVLFPIGDLKKNVVRELAKEKGLITHNKKDSTGICFIGKRNFKEFIANYLPMQKGELIDLDGKVVGEHSGAFYYTIGQRKGLGVGGPGDAWFVVDKDIQKNIVYVTQGHDHPNLYSTSLEACDLSFVSDIPLTLPYSCTAKVRYRQVDMPCTITEIKNGIAKAVFDHPQRAVTLGQSIVFYQGDLCLGGGIINKKSSTK